MPSDLTFRLVLLFFPGIICALIVENLTPTREWGALRFGLYSFVLGLATYLFYALFLAAWFCQWPPEVWFTKSLSDPKAVSYSEIAAVTGLAILFGFLVSVGTYRHWLHRLAKFLHVSRKFGDKDVWAFTFNSSDVTDLWAVVRDHEHNLAYQGWVDAFSETFHDNEVLLREVKVFQGTTSIFLYDVEAVYLSRQRDRLTIEFRRGTPLPTNQGVSNAQ